MDESTPLRTTLQNRELNNRKYSPVDDNDDDEISDVSSDNDDATQEQEQHRNHVSFVIQDDDDDDNGLSLQQQHNRNTQEENDENNKSDNEDEDDIDNFVNHRTGRVRSLSFESALFDDAISVITEVKDTITEGIVDAKEVLIEVMEEEVCIPTKPREEGDHAQKLSALALSILVFYKVSGGPFGCEPTVRAAGPFYALLGFICFPLIWCIQEALVTAELGSAYPEPSGSVAWIEEAFGPKAGLLCGYFHWISGATDNAIYPSLFLEYLTSYLHNHGKDDYNATDDAVNSSILSNEFVKFVITSAIAAVLAGINYTGLEIVGKLSIIVCIISMSPFLLLCIFGAPQVDPSRWFIMPSLANSTTPGDLVDDDALTGESFIPPLLMGGVLWRPFVNNLFWNLNSFDVGASFAGEVEHPERVFPKAMFLSVIFVVGSYLIPLLVALGASDTPQEDWKAGHLTVVSAEIVGPWLAAWTVFAAAVSNIALFEAEMSGDAYQLMGMADRGLIPKVFAKRSRFGTPTNGILVGTFVIFCLSVANFDALVEMLNFAYAVSLLMEFAAFIKLRITDNDVERPYRVPFNTFGCILFVSPACMICVFLMVVASKMTYVYFAILTIFGAGFHVLQKTAKHYNWWDYAEAPPKKRAKDGTNYNPGNTSPSQRTDSSLGIEIVPSLN